MTTTDEPDDGCTSVRELLDRQAMGRTPRVGEVEAALKHVRSCSDCRADARVRAWAAGLDAPDPTAEPSDAGRERRRDGVGARADAAAVSKRATARRGRRGWVAVAAVLTMVTAVAAALVAFWSQDAPHGPAQPTSPPARLILATDDVLVDGAPAVVGNLPRPGTVIGVPRGRAGVRVCGDVDLFIDARSRVRLGAGRTGSCAVALDAGRLTVEARRIAPGLRFVVTTTAGEVQVTGTLFAVEVVGTDVEVRVLEGSVELVGGTRARRSLRAPQAARLGDERPRALTPAELERDRRLAAVEP